MTMASPFGLTANSIVIEKNVFIVSRLELFTPHAHVTPSTKELDTWMKTFIRGSSYIVVMSDTKRHASKADGNLVPL